MEGNVLFIIISTTILLPVAALFLLGLRAVPAALPGQKTTVSLPSSPQKRGLALDGVYQWYRRARDYWTAWRSHQAKQYETLIIFDNRIAHMKRVPAAQVVPYLDHRARWVPHLTIWYVGGIIGGFLAVWGLAFWYWNGQLPPDAFIVAGTFSTFFAAIIGAPIGYWIGPKLGPKPFWVMRRLTDEKGKIEIESVIHPRFESPEFVPFKTKDTDGNTIDGITPQVFRATSMGESTEARDERDMYRGASSNNWEKIELGLMVTALIAIAGLLFLFATANS